MIEASPSSSDAALDLVKFSPSLALDCLQSVPVNVKKDMALLD
jgi:hypothetical protein